jgi:iron(II)-dependent oxidoreductase
MHTQATESSVLDEVIRARRITDALFAQLPAESMYDRPIPERHRLLFYVGHLEAFDWNQIGRSALGLNPLSEELDRLFAFGIDPPSGQLPQDAPGDWPTVDETAQYVRLVRRNLDREMNHAPEEAAQIALEHRLMHAETLTYLIHNLDYQRRRPPASLPGASFGNSPSLQMVEIPAGIATLGLTRGEGFGWDNEFEQHTRYVPPFAISKYKVTNAQYLEFVRQGGPPPHYWTERGGEWFYRGLHAEIPLPSNWPVYASHAQAESYAGWFGGALPTEAQFHRAAFGTPGEDERSHPRSHPWGSRPPTREHGNFDFQYADLIPVTATPAGDSAFGVSQLVGNGWEWTSSVFEPFDGFAPIPSYPGYSAGFFDGDHYVLKGGSCVTDARLLRSSFRNWFRAQYPYAYTTFRLVEN